MGSPVQIMQVIHISGFPINLFNHFDETAEIIIRISLPIYPAPELIIEIDIDIFKLQTTPNHLFILLQLIQDCSVMPDRYYRPRIGIAGNITLKIIRVIVRGDSGVFIDGTGRSKALQYSSSTNSKKSRKDGTILLFLKQTSARWAA